MLALDSPRWATMRRCDGYSTVVPALLRRLESPAHFKDERIAFDSLRLALIRCGEVDEVSYAAVPHLARLSQSGGVPAWEYVRLLAEVEARRLCQPSPPLPEDLAAAYYQAIRELPRLIGESRPEGEGAVASLAGALGQPRLGMAILHLGSEM